jgi:DNA-binding MarR family transcriptional regulator
MIDELEGAEYVQRRRNPADRRAYSIQPTPLSPQERLQLRLLLARLAAPET